MNLIDRMMKHEGNLQQTQTHPRDVRFDTCLLSIGSTYHYECTSDDGRSRGHARQRQTDSREVAIGDEESEIEE